MARHDAALSLSRTSSSAASVTFLVHRCTSRNSFQSPWPEASVFNGDVSEWDTAQVTMMHYMFKQVTVFNGDVSEWDTAKVTRMHYMFKQATVFNGDVSTWDTAKVTKMYNMFKQATVFNGDVSEWDTAKVTDAYRMFMNASSFHQNLSNWDTGNIKDSVQYCLFVCFDFAKDSGCQNPPSPATCGATFDNCESGPKPACDT